MNPENSPEDRLRDALAARAGRTRPSPDALDGVFGKVARHRRNVRLAAAAGTALSLAAVSVVAASALRAPDRATVTDEGTPTPTVSATVGPTPTPTPTVTASPTPTEYPRNRALVALADRVVEIDTTTGRTVRQVSKWNIDEAPTGLAWAPDRKTFVVEQGCIMLTADADTGNPRGDLGNGKEAAFSPDGKRLAYLDCEQRAHVGVIDLRTGRRTKDLAPPRATSDPSPGYGAVDRAVAGAVSGITWWDESRLVLARSYEGGWDAILVNPDTARSTADGTVFGDVDADEVAGGETGLYSMSHPWMPDPGGPSAVERKVGVNGPSTTAFQHPGMIGRMAVDRAGTLLFVDEDGLWRWDGSGAAELLVRGAAAVAT